MVLCRWDFSKQHFSNGFMRLIKSWSFQVGRTQVVFWWKYQSIIIGQDVVVCMSQRDLIRAADFS